MEPAPSDFWGSELSQAVFQSINVWVNVLDEKLNIMAWNPMAERISGYSSAEVVGHAKVWDWLYPDDAAKTSVQNRASELFVRDLELFNMTTEIVCRDGTRKHIAWYSRPIVINDVKDGAKGVVTFGHDVSEQRAASVALNRANRDLQVLYKIASITSEYTNLSQIFEQSLQQILQLTLFSAGAIYVWEGQGQSWSLGGHINMPKDLQDTNTLSGRMFEKDKLITSSLLGKRDMLLLPLYAKGRLQGALGILQDEAREMPSEQVNLLRSIAEQIGIAIDNARLYQRSKTLAVAEERQRLARDLHDSVTQSLYSLTLFAEAGQRMLKEERIDRVEQHLQRLSLTAQDALKEMRMLLFELRPWQLQSGKLIDFIKQRLDVVERRSNITAHLLGDSLPSLSPKVEENLYYITIEALNNALKHAHCSAVTVRFTYSKMSVQVEIADNGIGFEPDSLEHSRGMGLQNMAERISEFNGNITLLPNRSVGHGCIVRVVLPLTDEADYD